MATKGKNPPKKASKKNGYEMPKPLKPGDILTDNQKKQWKIGVSIGVGGFGEIYSACKAESSVKKLEDYPFVVKIEPKENGPLFVEMHFYMRNAKKEDIETFKSKHKLKSLGMPEFIAMGSQEIQQVKHRFIVLPRFGRDIYKIFEQNGHKFPLQTAYRISWQTINVLEYIHFCTYVHMDIKGSNILLGFGKGGDEQTHLLDFGLACHYNTKDFKPDPKKMHNGTIEYTSRDAHLGVPTMRGDIEILGYNLIEWAGGKLPWVVSKILAKPVDVQKSKEEFMKSPEKSLKTCFGSNPVPAPVTAYFKYLGSMNHDTKPDYVKLRGFLEAGLKELGVKNSGALEFSPAKTAAEPKKKLSVGKPNFGEPSRKIVEKPTVKRGREAKKVVEEDSEDEEDIPKKAKSRAPVKSPEIAQKPKRNREQKRYIESESDGEDVTPPQNSPLKKSRAQKSPQRSTSKENHDEIESPPIKKSKGKKEKEGEAQGVIKLKSKTNSKGNKKTIQLNFNLDVSMNSDVVVVVNRKDKKKKEGEVDEEKEGSHSEVQEINVDRAGFYKGRSAKTKK